MLQLSRRHLDTISQEIVSRPSNGELELPERVLQFGTGVLLRGLPDYFIDKANKQGVFNGRIVVVKSTSRGDSRAFDEQDGLYTLCIKGIEDGAQVDEAIVNGSISRVLSATTAWNEILSCARNPEMQIIISNTTESGIVFLEEDIHQSPPHSFPGKLLAFLYERFKAFKGDEASGLVVIPTELIVGNGDILRSILVKLAAWNKLEDSFCKWLTGANHFCNSLVDRIVPGAMSENDAKITSEKLGYRDELMIMAEPFRLWAIESDSDRVRSILSFSQVDSGMVIAPDIEKFRELKLRILNGTHTFSCAVALLSGFDTVKQAMQNEPMLKFVTSLMMEEIAPAVESEMISIDDARSFAAKVIERFQNPFLDHKWSAISTNFTAKMKMRNMPLFEKYYAKAGKLPTLMAFGFAAYIVFMNGALKDDGRFYHEQDGRSILIDDESAAYFHDRWTNNNREKMVAAILGDQDRWGFELNSVAGLLQAITKNIELIEKEGVMSALIHNRFSN
jgi:tagaturonate reductase